MALPTLMFEFLISASQGREANTLDLDCSTEELCGISLSGYT